MSQISLNTQFLGRPDQITRSGADQTSRRIGDSSSSARATDQVELSDAARQAAENSPSSPPVRLNLVQRVREQIANGTYETPSKIALASHELTRALKRQG